MGTEAARSWFDWSDSVETLDEIGAHHEREPMPQSTLAANDLHAIARSIQEGLVYVKLKAEDANS